MDTTVPSVSTFNKSSMIYNLNCGDLSFHLVPVTRLEIEKILRMSHKEGLLQLLGNTV